VFSSAVYGSYQSTKRNSAGMSFTICLLMLILIIFSSILHGNFLIVSRGSQYSYQLSIIGIFLSIYFANSIFIRYLSIGIISILFCLNINSIFSTYTYFKLNPAITDQLITRYSPNSKNWIGLVQQIKLVPDGPVLIAGYPGTAKPHFISSAIEPRGSIISTDIQKFWDLYSIPLLVQQKDFTLSDLFAIEPRAIKGDPINRINASKLAPLTNIAIINEASRDPIDWPDNTKLISRYRWRFSPIGDILQKNIYSNIELKIDGKLINKDWVGSAIIKNSITISPTCSQNCEQVYFEVVFSNNIDDDDLVIPFELSHYKIINNKLIIKYNDLRSSSILFELKRNKQLENIYLFQVETK